MAHPMVGPITLVLGLRDLVFEFVQQQFGIDMPQQFDTELANMAEAGIVELAEEHCMITHKGFLVLDEVLGHLL